jgi:long-chain acyl-CoA synthetase
MQSSLLARFHETGARHAGRPALIDTDGSLTFEEVKDLTARLAGWLASRGLGPGDTVGVAVRNERHHLLTCLALLRLGCPQVVLASHDPAALREDVAERCRVVAVVTDDDAAIDGPARIVPDFDALGSFPDPGDELAMPDDDAVAQYLASSGTTGRAKIIPLTHRMVMLQALTRQMPAQTSTEYIASSIEFLYPKKHRLRSVIGGYTSLFHKAEHAELPDICRRYKVDCLRLSPPQAQSLIDMSSSGAAHRLPHDMAVYVGGSRITPTMRAAFQRTQVHALHVEYGATETGNIAVAGPELHERLPDAVGRPLPGVVLEIVDDADHPLPPGVDGLIRIRTPGMATGYLNDEAMTARAFRDGWYYGGDRGHLNAEGVLIFGGRNDDMMILNSINIFPAEIERVAEGFRGVIDCAAFPMRSPVHGDIPMLAVVADETCDLKALMAFCRERLGIRAPRKVIGLDRLPRSAEGKVIRRELSARAGSGEFT